jgi:hypothetical protein
MPAKKATIPVCEFEAGVIDPGSEDKPVPFTANRYVEGVNPALIGEPDPEFFKNVGCVVPMLVMIAAQTKVPPVSDCGVVSGNVIRPTALVINEPISDEPDSSVPDEL